MMKKGKRTCEYLKEVRQRVARENGIPLDTRECTHEGDCRGTCPYCEAEVRYIEQELSKRQSLGKAVTIAGIAVSSMMMGSCHLPQTRGEMEQPKPASENTAQQISEETTGQEAQKPAPDQADTIEMVLGLCPTDTAPNKCTQEPKQDPIIDAGWDWETEGIIEDPSFNNVETHEWYPSIEGTPAQWLKSRLSTPLDFLYNAKYYNAYIVLIISETGEVKDVVFQPKEESLSANEQAFRAEATKILKGMPKWRGGHTAASYEIPLRDLR